MKSTVISIIIAGLFIVGVIFMGKSQPPVSSNQIENINNVSVIDGKQIVEITARGGYSPQVSVAKAGLPTILRVDTDGTFDCSASIRIPSLKVAQFLPQTGKTDIDLGTQKTGTLDGTCGMGMYRFQIQFK